MRGMELWRPDWARLMGELAHPTDSELVLVTWGTARLARSALRAQNDLDAYHNYIAAEQELNTIIEGEHYAKAS